MEKEKIEERIKMLEEESLKRNKKMELLNIKKIGTYSPNMVKIGMDILIENNL